MFTRGVPSNPSTNTGPSTTARPSTTTDQFTDKKNPSTSTSAVRVLTKCANCTVLGKSLAKSIRIRINTSEKTVLKMAVLRAKVKLRKSQAVNPFSVTRSKRRPDQKNESWKMDQLK